MTVATQAPKHVGWGPPPVERDAYEPRPLRDVADGHARPYERRAAGARLRAIDAPPARASVVSG